MFAVLSVDYYLKVLAEIFGSFDGNPSFVEPWAEGASGAFGLGVGDGGEGEFGSGGSGDGFAEVVVGVDLWLY